MRKPDETPDERKFRLERDRFYRIRASTRQLLSKERSRRKPDVNLIAALEERLLFSEVAIMEFRNQVDDNKRHLRRKYHPETYASSKRILKQVSNPVRKNT